MSDFKMSFISRETDTVDTEEVKFAVLSISCAWTSVNISCYRLHTDYIDIHFLTNSVIKKYASNTAIDWLSNSEDWAILPARSFMSRLWTETVLQSITREKWKKKIKTNNNKKEWPILCNQWRLTITLTSSLTRYQRLMCCSPQVQEKTP